VGGCFSAPKNMLSYGWAHNIITDRNAVLQNRGTGEPEKRKKKKKNWGVPLKKKKKKKGRKERESKKKKTLEVEKLNKRSWQRFGDVGGHRDEHSEKKKKKSVDGAEEALRGPTEGQKTKTHHWG